MHAILVPLDLSDASAGILEPAGALAALTQAHLTLFHVVEPFYGITDPGMPYPVAMDPAVTERRREERSAGWTGWPRASEPGASGWRPACR